MNNNELEIPQKFEVNDKTVRRIEVWDKECM